MRTKKQVRELIKKILKLPANYSPSYFVYCYMCVEYKGLATKPHRARFDDMFMSLEDDMQDVIIQHEKGHLVAVNKKLPAHMEWDKKCLAGETIPASLYFRQELEADIYCAKKVGLDKVLAVFKATLDLPDLAKRRRNLKRAMKE